MRFARVKWAALAVVAMVCAVPQARAQQRPLATEDPESIGAGRILIEAGAAFEKDQKFPVSGLQGNLWKVGTYGLSVGVSSIAELQIDGGVVNVLRVQGTKVAPGSLASVVTLNGATTKDVEDVVVAMKIRMVGETAGHPAFGVRFATRLPNASNESGLGLDTTDFSASLLVGKTVQSVRTVANIGVGILGDPTDGNRQNDVFTYGLSLARAVTQQAELVAEINGRASVRQGDAFPGTESRGTLKVGARFTHGPVRFDAGVYFGLNAIDATIGGTAGFTYIFNAFTLP